MNESYREIALVVIESYIWDLKDPGVNYKRDRFAQSSYSKWAAEEVYEFVKQHENLSPIDAIEVFIKKMDNYACINPNNSYIFSVAHDVAEDILDILL